MKNRFTYHFLRSPGLMPVYGITKQNMLEDIKFSLSWNMYRFSGNSSVKREMDSCQRYLTCASQVAIMRYKTRPRQKYHLSRVFLVLNKSANLSEQKNCRAGIQKY